MKQAPFHMSAFPWALSCPDVLKGLLMETVFLQNQEPHKLSSFIILPFLQVGFPYSSASSVERPNIYFYNTTNILAFHVESDRYVFCLLSHRQQLYFSQTLGNLRMLPGLLNDWRK